MEEAKNTESVCNGNKDNIWILFNEVATIKQLYARSTCYESASVNPHHDGLLGGRRIVGLINIQV